MNKFLCGGLSFPCLCFYVTPPSQKKINKNKDASANRLFYVFVKKLVNGGETCGSLVASKINKKD